MIHRQISYDSDVLTEDTGDIACRFMVSNEKQKKTEETDMTNCAKIFIKNVFVSEADW